MEADFSGYATKAGLKCSDGRTIMPEAFQHMDGAKVPLVWQHGHNNPENVLGHAVLEKRNDGVYAYGFFNDTSAAQNAKALVEHGDINALSIYANQLVEKSKQVFHGVIREVSLVLSGANPGALIDNVNIAHSDGSVEYIDDEAVIYTDEVIEHAARTYTTQTSSTTKTLVDGVVQATRTSTSESSETIDEGAPQPALVYSDIEHADGKTVQDVYDSLSQEQKDVVNFMIGAALQQATGNATHSATSEDGASDEADNAGDGSLNHQEGNDMSRNVFEQNGTAGSQGPTLSHSDVRGIVQDAIKRGSLREAVEDYAIQHGIDNIDVLFPDAQAVSNTPEFIQRRAEWVAGVINGAKHSPFSRIKSLSADITHEEARARGYIKGNFKKEEFFSVSSRVTTPTTVYKKQKLDRDDIIDITSFDVVAWLKAEMRLMLDEELARAVLIGDGRDVADDDKIKDPVGATEGAGIRSILNDHELYVTTVNVNLDDANSDASEIIDAIARSRKHYKGTGTPTLYTTEAYVTDMLLLRDKMGRRLYRTVADLAAELRVADVVAVEVMETVPDLVGIVVNMSDYTLGADRGGEISMFDDFDIDYNQYKYLLETRLSGALTKLKSALVVRKVAATDVLVEPAAPTFDEATGVVTIPTDANADYSVNGTPAADGSTTTLNPGQTATVTATPTAGHYFATNADDEWTFQRPRAQA